MSKKRAIFILSLLLISCLCLLFTSCKSVKATISFMVDGKVYDTIDTSGNEIITMPTNPAKEGYKFDGWYWDDGVWNKPFTANSLLDAPLSSDMAVYAKFSKGEDYANFFDDIAKIIQNNAQTQNTLKDGISYIYTGAYKQTASNFSFEMALFYNEMYQSNNNIVAELIVKMNAQYTATIMLTFGQQQEKSIKGVFTDYSTKSKGEFYISPENYYNNSNVVFDQLTWGSGYEGLANLDYPHRLSYEYSASAYTEYAISLFDKFLNSKLSYGIDKLNFVNAKNSKKADAISTIYCDQTITLKEGQSVELDYTTFPCYSTKDETVTSNNKGIATVSGKTVTGVSEGTTTVTISSGNISKTVSITVKPITNADIVRGFLNKYVSDLFDSEGNKINDAPDSGVYYALIRFPDDIGNDTFSITCTYKYSSPTSLAPSVYTMYFNLPNDNNVIDQIYNTATGTYAYYKNSVDRDATSLNNYHLISSGRLSFKYTETSFMKTLESENYFVLLQNMQTVAEQTVEVLGKILSKNSTGCLDTNKTASFELSIAEVYSNNANFVCNTTNYFGEHISSAMLYSGGSLVRDCTSEFSQNFALNNLNPKTLYLLEVTFAYNKNDGNGEQTVKRTVEFTTPVDDNTPYTITYNANGGQVEQSTQTVKYNNSYSLLTPSWTGHQFDGWYYNGDLFDNSGTWKLDADITLIAQWSLAVYDIHYDNITGATNNNPSTYTYGSSLSINAPTKTGYKFIGWITSASDTPSVDFKIAESSTGDKYLTACWEANEYTVTFECNGADEELSQMQIKYDAWFALPNITRAGYTFNGWYNGTTKMSNAYYKYTQDIVLSARWTANTNTPYAVEHYQQNIDDDDYTLFKTTNYTGTSDASVSPAVESYTGFTSPSRQSTTISADGSLVVKYYYTRNTYTVSYVTNGGVAMESTSHKYGSTLNLVDAEREGFTFGGWFTNVGLTSSIQDITMPTNNINVYAWWQEETKAGDFSYSGTSSVTISKYNGTSTSVRIPSFIGGIEVTAIGASAFQNNTTLVSVTLNGSIVNIGNYAFSGCAALSQFNSENANELIVPNGVEIIGQYVFQNVSLITRIVVADSVTSIGLGAFKGCNTLKDITLPFVGASESEIQSNAVFGYIFGWTVIEGWTRGSGFGSGYINSQYGTQPQNTIWQFTEKDRYGAGTDLTYFNVYYCHIPTTIQCVDITHQTAIPIAAFNNCNFIEKINISTNTKSIGAYAFQNCSALKQLNSDVDGDFNIPTNVTAVNEYTFYGNQQVAKVTLGQNVTSIGNYAFSGCSALTQFNSDNENEIVIPSGVQIIGKYAFQNVALVTKIVVADSVTSIGVGAFKGCNVLEDITLPFVGNSPMATEHNSVFGYIFGEIVVESGARGVNKSTGYVNMQCGTQPENSTWQYTVWSRYASGTDITYHNCFYYNIPATIKYVTITVQIDIPIASFNNCNFIEKITLPTNTKSIGAYAFQNCSALKQLNSDVDGDFNIPTNVTAVNEYTFYGNQQVAKVTLGQNVTSIGNYAFSGCSALSNINVTAKATISSTAFTNSLLINKTGVCYVGELLYCYNGTMPSGYVLNVKPNTAAIYDNALKGQTGLTKVILPESLMVIGASSFEGCTALAEINTPDSLETLGTRAFYNCKLLTDIDLKNIEIVSQYAFYGCAALQTFSAENAITVDSYAFQNCTSLVEVSLPKVQTISASAFSSCVLLSKFNSEADGQLILPDCCESVGASAFENCKALVDVDFANATWGTKVLANCISLEKLSIAAINTYFGTVFGTTSATGLYAAKQNTTTYYIPTLLKEVTLTVQSSNQINAYSFANCKSLVKVTLPNNVTTLGVYAFSGCVALQQIVLPADLTAIGEHCFDGCTVLTDVDLTRCSLQTINAYAFQNCSALQEIYISANVTYIGEYAFNGCTNLTISCQVAEYPFDWDYNWNPSNCEVVWGVENV